MENSFVVRDMRNKEKFFIDDEYINGYAKYLDPNATAVYISLCRHADKEQNCFPAEDMIAKQHNICKRTVVSKIKTLKEHNLIVIARVRNKNGKFSRNTYILIDKKYWKNIRKPNQVQNLHMDKNQVQTTTPPSANNDINQVQQMHTKDTHYKDKDTHKKDTQRAYYNNNSKELNNIIKDLTNKLSFKDFKSV